VLAATSALTDDVSARPVFPAEVLDGIADLMAQAADPGDRASVVWALVSEIYATAAWLIDSPGSRELLSMEHLVAEARAHHARMTGLDARRLPSDASSRGIAAVADISA